MGEQAAQALREDELAAEIFGLEKGAPSASTVYRVLCDLAGLPERKREEHYETSGRALSALDMLGRPRRTPRRRRIVPDTPEAATPESRAALDAFVAASAKSCAQALPRKMLQLQGWYVVADSANPSATGRTWRSRGIVSTRRTWGVAGRNSCAG